MQELIVPSVGESIVEVEVGAWLKGEGEAFRRDEPLVELITDKATLELPAPFDGVLRRILKKTGETARVGEAIALLEAGAAEAAPTPEAGEKPKAPEPLAMPAAERLMAEHGVRPEEVRGTGLGGRITKEDVERAARAKETPRPPEAPKAIPLPSLPDLSRFGPVRREAMTGVRRATARNMAQAWSLVPMVTHFDEADITELEALRKRYAKRAEERGFRLTLTAFLLKALALAVRAHPKFGAAVDHEREEIVYRDYVHIGVAVDTPHGLLVPVIRDVDQKGVFRLAQELQEVSERAKARKLTPEEMQGATISLSNLGGIGGTGFTPIVNWPEVAILGVARSRIAPVWDGEAFRPRLLLPFGLTYDHRLIDGAEAARFCRHLAGLLEDPVGLALE